MSSPSTAMIRRSFKYYNTMEESKKSPFENGDIHDRSAQDKKKLMDEMIDNLSVLSTQLSRFENGDSHDGSALSSNNKKSNVNVAFWKTLTFMLFGAMVLFAMDMIQSRQASKMITSTVELMEEKQPTMASLYDYGSSFQNSDSSPYANDSVQFVFFMGLEGTGHHFLKTLARYSPLKKKLQNLNVFPKLTKKMNELLFGEEDGLFRENPSNSTHLELEISELLVELKSSVIMATSQERETVTIPLNILHSCMSYPFGEEDGREKRYPMLDLIYQACDMANVSCRHVLMYRNALDIVKSSYLNRNFYNKTTLQANLKMYNSMLDTLSMQLINFADQTLGCIGLFQQQQEEQEYWQELMVNIFWYDDSKSVEKLYRKPDSKKLIPDDMIPLKMKTFMDLMNKKNKRALEICQNACRRNRRHV